jgi:hypothetical protein
MMKLNNRMVVPAIAALLMSWSTLNAQDQSNRPDAPERADRPGRGSGFDPARIQEFRERRMERLKDQLEIKDDAEWKAIQPLIQKVQDIQQQMFADRIRGEMGGSRGGGGDRGGDRSDGGRGFRGGFGGTPSPEAQALEKAIEGKASNSDLKAALGKLQESRKAKQSELEKAQADLRKVLSLRQEAVLTASGVL